MTVPGYKVLEITFRAYAEIRSQMVQHGFSKQLREDGTHGEVLDMSGVALKAKPGQFARREEAA